MVFDTIYVGGGTPSLLKPFYLRKVLEEAQTQFYFVSDPEVTIEVNPGTVDLHALQDFLAGGVNRVNLGVQSFDDKNLQFLRRLHSARECGKAIDLARRAGIQNLGLDLIYGFPKQTSSDWLADLKEAVIYEPEHLSCYMLTYVEGTDLDKWRNEGRCHPLMEDALGDLFEVTVDYLETQGYQQYEVSNFARDTRYRSRHNQKYWCHAPYIGIGPSAHSFLRSRRWWNCGDLDNYLQALGQGMLPPQGTEALSKNQLMLETVFLGLRTREGIDASVFKARYDVDFFNHFRLVIDRLAAGGFLSLSSGRCALTREGMLVSDTIAGIFADHLVQ
jgi:oxygen-independent coproporphyrinogen-3 oxidase